MNKISENSIVKYVHEKFLNTVKQFSLFEKGDRVLVGLSGGADSVLLTHLLNSFKEDFSIEIFLCHVNHSLRGKESDRDAIFSRNFAEKLGLPFFSFNVDVRKFAFSNGLSIEEAARVLRYKSFEKTIKEYRLNKLATGHNLDDLFETILYRLLKGTGIDGLISIPVKKSISKACYELVRPLIFIEKIKIEEYLKTCGIDFVFDSSNKDLKYSRNYIRNRITPLLEEKFPYFRKKIGDFYKILWEEEKFWESEIKKYTDFIVLDNKSTIIKKEFFDLTSSDALKRRIIRFIINEVMKIDLYLPLKVIDRILKTYSKNGTKIYYDSKRLVILTSYGDMIFENKDKLTERLKDFKIIELNERVCFNNKTKIEFIIEKKEDLNSETFKSTPDKIFFNADHSKKFFLRKLKKGDKIYIGNRMTKKISDIFIDSKIKIEDRKKAFVITDEREKAIAVIIPFKFSRVSKEFYVTEDTKKVAILCFS